MFCLSVPALSQDQIDKDLNLIGSSFLPQEGKTKVKRTIDFRNEFNLIFSASYNFYKSYVSSQDANTCAFSPSCSTYALETIKTNGVMGVFDALDRLTRCNGFSPDKYPVHSESQHFYDPVKKIL